MEKIELILGLYDLYVRENPGKKRPKIEELNKIAEALMGLQSGVRPLHESVANPDQFFQVIAREKPGKSAASIIFGHSLTELQDQLRSSSSFSSGSMLEKRLTPLTEEEKLLLVMHEYAKHNSRFDPDKYPGFKAIREAARIITKKCADDQISVKLFMYHPELLSDVFNRDLTINEKSINKAWEGIKVAKKAFEHDFFKTELPAKASKALPQKSMQEPQRVAEKGETAAPNQPQPQQINGRSEAVQKIVRALALMPGQPQPHPHLLTYYQAVGVLIEQLKEFKISTQILENPEIIIRHLGSSFFDEDRKLIADQDQLKANFKQSLAPLKLALMRMRRDKTSQAKGVQSSQVSAAAVPEAEFVLPPPPTPQQPLGITPQQHTDSPAPTEKVGEPAVAEQTTRGQSTATPSKPQKIFRKWDPRRWFSHTKTNPEKPKTEKPGQKSVAKDGKIDTAGKKAKSRLFRWPWQKSAAESAVLTQAPSNTPNKVPSKRSWRFWKRG